MQDPKEMDNLALAFSLEHHQGACGIVCKAAAARLRNLDALVKAQMERIGAQSDLLSKVAEDRFLAVADVVELLVISERTLWRMVQRKEFPQPVRFNRKLVRWKSSAVRKWMSELES